MPRWFIVLALAAAAALQSGAACSPAETVGWTSDVTGGAGKPICQVSLPYDSVYPGAGTLRSALNFCCKDYDGCTVTFAPTVKGTIVLQDDLRVTGPNVTIDGSGAGGRGIQLVGHELQIRASNVIVRNLRVRPHTDPAGPVLAAGIAVDASSNDITGVVLDHVSLEWASNKNLRIEGYNGHKVSNVTVKYSILAEPLRRQADQPGTYSSLNVLGCDGDCDKITFYRNLFATAGDRNPTLGNARDATLTGTRNFQVIQNLVYNYVTASTVYNVAPGQTWKLDWTNNIYQLGPMSINPLAPLVVLIPPWVPGNQATLNFWLDTNLPRPLLPNDFTQRCGEFSTAFRSRIGCDDRREIPWNQPPYSSPVQIQGPAPWPPSAGQSAVYQTILDTAGATLPCRDPLDARIVADVRNNTCTDCVGGWPAYPQTLPDLTQSCP